LCLQLHLFVLSLGLQGLNLLAKSCSLLPLSVEVCLCGLQFKVERPNGIFVILGQAISVTLDSSQYLEPGGVALIVQASEVIDYTMVGFVG